MSKLVIDGTIAVVLALLLLLYVFLSLGDIVSALVAFVIAVAISLGALLVAGRRRSKTNLA